MSEADPLGGSKTVETRYGRLVTPGDTDLIGRFLARCGEWAWDEASFVASTLTDGARVLDAGAFLGTFGLGLALQKPLGFLCFVEANVAILPMLEANVKANAPCAFSVVGAMLHGGDTPPRPGRGDPQNLGSVSFVHETGDYFAEPTNRALTLGELRNDQGDFDLVKLDLEGMEREIIYGDREHLSRGATSLWIECNETRGSLELVDLLLSWRLETYYFAFPSHNPANFRGEKEPIFPWSYEAGLLVGSQNAPRLTDQLIAHDCILRPIKDVEDLREALWCTPRWLPAELAHAKACELAAVAGRSLLGQKRDNFLQI